MRLSNKNKLSIPEIAYPLKRRIILWSTDRPRTDLGTGVAIFGDRMQYSQSMLILAGIFQVEVYAIEKCAQFSLDWNHTVSAQYLFFFWKML